MIHLQFLLASVLVLGIIVAAGMPVVALALPRLRHEVVLAAAPIIGLAVLATFGWYWCSFVDGGLHPALLVFAMCCAVIGVALISISKTPVEWRVVRRLAAVVAVQLAAFGALSLPMTSAGEFTSVSIGNNDVASYALVADHLMDHGFSATDRVVGVSLAREAQEDVFGAYVLLTAAASGTARPLWKVTSVGMAVASVAAVLALVAFSRRVFGLGSLASGVLSIASCNTFLFSFMAGHYFLSQVLGIACAALLTTLLAEPEKVPWRPLVAVAALVMAAFVLTYPHMLIVGAPVWAGVALVAVAQRSWHAFRRSLVIGAVGAMAVGLTLPVRAFGAVSRTLTLGTGLQGFPIAALSPAEVLGLQRSLSWPPSPITVVASTVAVVMLTGFAMLALRHERRVAVTAVYALVSSAAVYLLLLVRYGDHGYPAAKWIAFFQPTVVVSAGALAALSIARMPRFQTAPRATREGIALACGALATVIAFNGHAAFEPAYAGEAAVVEDDLYTLAEAPSLERVSSVNLDVPTFWETLWGVYFLRDRVVYPVSPYYYPPANAEAPWTLVRRDALAEGLPSETVPVNQTYVLVPTSSRRGGAAPSP